MVQPAITSAATDIGASIEFWCDRLGFAIAYQRPE
jgi:hypothetical protein